MTKFRIGRHISTGYGILTAPGYAKRIGCNIFQIFLGFPQQIISKAKPPEVLAKLGEELAKNRVKMVVHGSYTINLCHPATNKLFKTSVKSLVQDLNSSAVIGKKCLGVIVHMGKNISANKLSEQEAIKNYIAGLKIALKQTPENTTIILETGASQGTEVASEIEGLVEIYWGLDEAERLRVKFCIDTCHIWASNYDISTPKGVNAFFNKFNEQIGIDKIACIHFNDSKTVLGSHVDRHADIGYGYIGDAGLKAVAKYAKKNKLPLICETPLDSVKTSTNSDITVEDELEKINSWLKN